MEQEKSEQWQVIITTPVPTWRCWPFLNKTECGSNVIRVKVIIVMAQWPLFQDFSLDEVLDDYYGVWRNIKWTTYEKKNICHDGFYFGIRKKIRHSVNSHQISYYHILLHLFHKRKKWDSQSLGDEIKDTRIYQYWKRESVFSSNKMLFLLPFEFTG